MATYNKFRCVKKHIKKDGTIIHAYTTKLKKFYMKKTTPNATESPTIRDLEWAAGFLEGEGSFIRANSCKRGCEMISAPQKNIESLSRLQKLFGGSLTTRPTKEDYRMNVWQVYGVRARGIMMTLFTLMSCYRKGQIKNALMEV